MGNSERDQDQLDASIVASIAREERLKAKNYSPAEHFFPAPIRLTRNDPLITDEMYAVGTGYGGLVVRFRVDGVWTHDYFLGAHRNSGHVELCDPVLLQLLTGEGATYSVRSKQMLEEADRFRESVAPEYVAIAEATAAAEREIGR